MRYGSRSVVCTRRPLSKSALLATCNSNGLRSTNCRCMTMRTPQSFRGGTMLTSRTRRLTVMQQCHRITAFSFPNTVRLAKNRGRKRLISPLALKAIRNNCPCGCASAPKGAWLSPDARRSHLPLLPNAVPHTRRQLCKSSSWKLSISVSQCSRVKALTACRVSIEYRERLFNFRVLVLRQHALHCLKNNLIVEFFHTRNVIGTSIAPMDNRRSIVTKQAGDIAEQAKGRRVWWQY